MGRAFFVRKGVSNTKDRAFDKSKYNDWIDPAEAIPYERNAKEHNAKQIRNIVNSIRRTRC